jgi:tetratricopeptide (TPR) repeat protein
MNPIQKETRRLLAMSILLVGATLIAFWPSIHNDFIYFDEGDYLFNAHVKNGLSWANCRWAFATGYAFNWHPLTWLSHMLDVQLFGLKPAGHHVVSMVIHIGNAVLLLWFLNKATSKPWRSFFVAGLFALHPLHVESVAWAAERKDVLSTFFFMLTLLFYARYVEQARRGEGEEGRLAGSEFSGMQERVQKAAPASPGLGPGRSPSLSGAVKSYGLSLLFFTLGLMSKPMLVTLPFVLLLLDHWPLGRFNCGPGKSIRSSLWPLVREKLPFLCLSLASCVITRLVQAHAVWEIMPLNRRVYNALASYLKYLGETFWPTGLVPYYPHPEIYTGQWATRWIWAAALCLVVISVLCVVWAWRRPWLGVGWFWYLGTLVPVIGLVQVGTQGMADRYTYVPLIGVFVSLVWSIAEVISETWLLERVAAVFGVTVLVVCAAMTRHQLRYWRDGVTAFGHAAAVNPFDSETHTMLAGVYAMSGQVDKAAPHFRMALLLNRASPKAHAGVGMILAGKGKVPEAIREFEKALKSEPGFDVALKGLRAAYWAQDRRAEAVEQSMRVLEAKPEDTQEHMYLGGMLWEMERREEAVAQYRDVVRLDPHDSVARYKLGYALSQMGYYREGAEELSEALRLGHKDFETYSEYGRTLAALGDLEAARLQFEAGLTLSPTNANLRVNLANALWMSGHTNDAVSNFAAAAVLQPGLAQETLNSGKALASAGQFAAALGKFSTAMRLHPDWPEAMSATAWVLATAPEPSVRNGPEALRLAERAAALTDKKDVHVLTTLDAAYAEAGRFPEAIAAAEETRNVAVGTGNEQAVQAANERLDRYRKNFPAHN